MKKKKRIAIVVVGLIVLIFGVCIWWFLSQQDNKLSGNYKESESKNYIEYGDKKYKYNEHLSNYLFLGIDTREPVETNEGRSNAGQSDAIMLVSYDRVKKTAICLTIPRDTMTNVQIITPDGTDIGKGKEQITLQYAYGDGKHKSCELTKAAVSEMLYGVPIQGYCSVNMDGIPIAVGQVGSVDVVVPNSSLEEVNSIYKEGATVTITQENAEEFVRYRDVKKGFSAMDRLERQRAFANAFGKVAQEKAKKDSDFVISMYENLEPYMVTNIGTDVFVKLAEAKGNISEEIQNIPGEKVDGIEFDEYHINETQLFELILQMFYEEVQED